MKEQKSSLIMSSLNLEQSKVSDKKIYCSGDEESSHSCLNKNCIKYAFVCDNQKCKCTEQHAQCLIVKTKTIINGLKSKLISPKPLIDCVEKGIDKIIDQLSDYKENIINQLTQKYNFFGLNKDEKQLFRQIQSGQVKNITGQMVWKAHLDFQKEPLIIDQMKKTIIQLNSLLNKINQDINPKKIKIKQTIKKQYEFNQFCLQKNKKILTYQRRDNPKVVKSLLSFQNSKILTQFEHVQTLLQFFLPRNLKKIQLLYKASDHNYEISKFHQKCDNIPNTLTICETKYNKIIGGYTPLAWSSHANGQRVVDQSRQSFVFSISNKQKFIYDPNNKYAICRYKGYGPSFGGQGDNNYDLHIYDKANISTESHSYIGKIYKHPDYKEQTKESYQKFCGNPSNSPKFKTTQWEVWKIQFQ